MLRYALFALAWGAVGGYLLYAAATARRLRAGKVVQRLEVEAADSSAQGHLVSAARVRSWIAEQGIATVGTAVDAVDLDAIERTVLRSGFVERAVAYVTYDGVLRVEIGRRDPLLRLALDGYDAYATEGGYVFPVPRASALYVPVVTGSYRPPFPAAYAGEVRAHIEARKAEIERRIAELEAEKYPFYRRERANDRNLAEVRRMRIKRRWWRGEGSEEFDRRVEELRALKAALRRRYRYEARLVEEGIEAVAQRQEAQRREQKKLDKSYEDFVKLLTFVKFVEEDDFWRSEVVQIIAQTTSSGALEVDLVPRSGSCTIRFGRLEDTERKFAKLMRFYRSGLTRVGWDAYRTIDIRFGDQVICSKQER